jgi:glutamate N-acetyltransferase/amino-acid N-acetyltransferase
LNASILFASSLLLINMAPKTVTAKQAFKAIFQVRQYSAPADRSIPAAKQKYIPTSGTYPKGFLVGSAHAGVKASNTKYDDLALVTSEEPCAAAAVFTQNIFKAAPVNVSKDLLYKRQSAGFRGVVVNSGCANAVTGTGGMEDAVAMASATDKALGATPGEVPSTLVMSTGVIGQRLPIKKITDKIPALQASLGNTHEHWLGAASAICTTDTFPKLISRTFTLPSQPDTTYSIAGMTKGAGMIHPNMATLLGIVCTDVAIDPQSLRSILRTASNRSFNCISIDGDTSTNDTVALLANGAAAPVGTTPIYRQKTNRRDEQREAHPDLAAFQEILKDFMEDLAKLVVRDGEGATKFVTIRVQADENPANARRAAVSIATSALVKTALYGKDANWGRILCAIGYAPGIMESREVPLHKSIASFSEKPDRLTRDSHHKSTYNPVKPEETSVSFIPADGSEELKLLVRGEPEQVDEERAKQILEMEDLEISVKLSDKPGKEGPSKLEEVFWTCDFSHEYVTINGDYRT